MLTRILSGVAASLFAASLAQGAQPRHPDAPAPESRIGDHVQQVRIPLRDGVELTADLYLPEGKGPHPVLMEVTPYGRRSAYSFSSEHGYWTSQGYAFLVVDARGAGDSGGTFRFMADARSDGPQIVEWAASQPWSTGKVGMRGSSYSGSYPIQTAIGNPRGLACISPNANFQSGFDGPPYIGGALMQAWATGWTTLVVPSLAGKTGRVDFDKLLAHRPLLTADKAAHGVEVPVYRQILAHQTADEFWAEAHLSVEDYRRINIPTLAFTGWYDTTLPGSISNYRAMRALAAASEDQWLVVGPWDHGGASEGGYARDTGEPIATIGALAVEPTGFKPGQRMAREFFDWCLKGTAARPGWPNVQMFVPGQNRWIAADRLPIQGVRPQTLYLGGKGPANAPASRGQLLPGPAVAAADSYVHDPANPVRSDTDYQGRRVQLYGPEDVSAQLARPDVLTYSTGPLPAPLTLLGNAGLTLFLKADAPDVDIVALLEDVAPDGKAIRLGSGWAGVLRARYRNGPARLEPLKPGDTTRLRVNLLENGHTLKPGHSLRLSVFGSAYPFISVNPATGNDIASDTAPPRKARITLLHGAQHPSALILEVLEADPR
jgi:putative CocE/NonD family hydrolase